MNGGAVLVAGLVRRLGASAMARALNLTEGAVRAHAGGAALPRAGVRRRYRERYDVPEESWDIAAGAAPQDTPESSTAIRSPRTSPKPAGRAASTPEAPEDARAAVVDLLRVARGQLEAAQADEEVPYRERAQLITSATGLCRLLARLSGELELTEAQIVRSAPFKRLLDKLDAVLERHPAAARDWHAALAAGEES